MVQLRPGVKYCNPAIKPSRIFYNFLLLDYCLFNKVMVNLCNLQIFSLILTYNSPSPLSICPIRLHPAVTLVPDFGPIPSPTTSDPLRCAVVTCDAGIRHAEAEGIEVTDHQPGRHQALSNKTRAAPPLGAR